jgi:hypothetical protein
LDDTLGQNADPLIIQAGAESGPENQMSLNLWKTPAFNPWELIIQLYPPLKVCCRRSMILNSPLKTLNAARGQMGAVDKRLVSTSNSLNIKIENLTLSESG